MIKKLNCLFLLFAIPYTLLGQDFYLSTSGNDNNDGSKDSPVQSFEKAKELVRAAIPNAKNKITVWVAPGTYDCSKALVFSKEDSGNSDLEIVWRAEKPKETRLVGGKVIPSSAFTKVKSGAILKRFTKEAADNILQVDLKKFGITDYGTLSQYGQALPVTEAPLELFVDSKPMLIAQYPDSGYVQLGERKSLSSNPRNGDTTKVGGSFYYKDLRHERWVNDDIWLKGYFGNGYADDNVKIADINKSDKSIELAMPPMYGLSEPKDYLRYIAVNILEEITMPSEYYVDKKSGILYFYPECDLTDKHVTVSITEEPILVIEECINLTIRDFIIECGRGIGVYMEGGSDNTIAGCTVRGVGTTGICIGKGARQTYPHPTHDQYTGEEQSRYIGSFTAHMYLHPSWERNAGTRHTIQSCDIYDTGSGGVILGGGDKRNLVKGENRISNSVIYNYSRRNRFCTPGINTTGCGNIVSNNKVFDSPQHAIFNMGPEHIYEYNEIHHVGIDANDISAWYMGRNPSDRGVVVRYNYFHDCGNADLLSMGVYCDDSSGGAHIFGNIFENMHTQAGVVYSNTGWDIKVENNIIIEPLTSCVVLSTHYYTWYKGGAEGMFNENGLLRRRLTEDVDIYSSPFKDKYPELLHYLDKIPGTDEWYGMHSKGNVFRKNIVMRANDELIAIWDRKYPHDFIAVDNFETTDSYSFEELKDGAIIDLYKRYKSFAPIPIDKMGLFKDEYRQSTEYKEIR